MYTHTHTIHTQYDNNILQDIALGWADIWTLTEFTGFFSSPQCLCLQIRAEWKHTFLEIAKGAHGLWSTSQHWFQNNWRNHYRMNILLRNRENISYRCKKCLPIFGKGYSSDNNFVNCYGISAVTYTGNCSGLLQNDVKICKTKNGQKTKKWPN